jgi:hypothetical protein
MFAWVSRAAQVAAGARNGRDLIEEAELSPTEAEPERIAQAGR